MRMPSPAMAVSLVALVAALCGTAVALPGRNSVKRDDIAAGAVNGGDIKDNAVRGNDVGNDALTGADVKESALGVVPRATRADSAAAARFANWADMANSANTAIRAGTAGRAGDLTGRKIAFRAPQGTAATNVLDIGGLVLTASCSAGAANNLSVIASTTVNDAFFLSRSINAGGVVTNVFTDDDFDAGEQPDIVAADQDHVQGHTTYETPAGSVVTATWQANEDTPSTVENCTFSGTALQALPPAQFFP